MKIVREYKCGCKVKKAEFDYCIEMCDLHDAAPELVEALELAAKYVAKMVADDVQTALPPQVALNRIEQALAKAQGKEGER